MIATPGISMIVTGGDRVTKRYLTCAETAKEVRAVLKRYWPGLKFSVRSDTYSGGASIRVRWYDGPTGKQVEKRIGCFAGASFDGMVDLKEYHDSTLRGEVVSFGANYVFCERQYSAAFLGRIAQAVAKDWGFAPPEIHPAGEFGGASIAFGYGMAEVGYPCWTDRIMWAAQETVGDNGHDRGTGHMIAGA